MSIKIRKYQNTNSKSKTFNKWYGRVVTMNEVTTDDLADIIQENCSMKKSDVAAVLKELAAQMKRELENGHRVVIDGLGAFKVSVKSKPADKKEDFSVDRNIYGTRILFAPSRHKLPEGGWVKELLANCKFAEMPTGVSKSKALNDGEENTGSDQDNTTNPEEQERP